MFRVWLAGAVLAMMSLLSPSAHAASEPLMTRFDSMVGGARLCDDGSPVMCTGAANNLRLIPPAVRQSLREKAQAACDQHGADGCWQLGIDMIVEAAALPIGAGVTPERKRDLDKAARLFRDACQSGSAEGCRQIILGEGWLSPLAPDKPKLVARMKQLCDANLATACFSLGQALQVGFNHFPLDPVQGRQALAKGCNLGEARACDLIARALEAHEMEWSGPKAFPELFTIACDRGSDRACVTLAERYAQNPALAQAPEHAAKALETGCSLANAEACAGFAQILLDGTHGSADPVRAKALFTAACGVGRKEACFSAAALWLKGEPDVRALVQAHDILLSWCSHGADPECAQLAEVEQRLIADHQQIAARGPILVLEVNPVRPEPHKSFRSDVQFTVALDGVVKDCSASGGGAEIDRAVCSALMQSTYLPAIGNSGKHQSTVIHMVFAG